MFNSKLFLVVGIAVILGFIFAFFSVSGRLHDHASLKRSVDKAAAQVVLEKYFNAWINARPEEMYKYLSREDLSEVSLSDYVQQFNEYPIRPAGYSLISITPAGERLQFELNVLWPDLTTGKSIERTESFYLAQEDSRWVILEACSIKE